MAWRPKKQSLVTAAEVAMAKSLLPPNPAWKIGVIQTNGHIQFRGAMHPDSDGSGTHPGVEVWTDIAADQHGAVPMAEDLGTSTVDEIETVLAAVEAVSNYPRDEVYSTIMIESGWKPHNYFHHPKVKPENAASGLIGFMPSTLAVLGWTGPSVPGRMVTVNGKLVPSPDMTVFRQLSTAEQAEWVARYFDMARPWGVPGDTYLATAAGGAVGRPDSYVVYKAGTPEYDLNKVWDIDKDGDITAGELRQILLKRMKKAPEGGEVITPSPKDPAPGGSPSPDSPSYYLVLSTSPAGALGSTHEGLFNSQLVRLLQSLLKAQGLYLGNVDGDHGPLTEAAIKRYMARQ